MSWLDKYEVKADIGAITKFTSKNLDCPVFVSDQGYDTHVYYEPSGLRKFNDEVDALHFVQSLFMKADIMGRIKKIDIQKSEYQTVSRYQSGDVGVLLLSKDNTFWITVGGTPMAKTEDLGVAIDRYYQAITSILMAKDDNKDIPLEIFGQKVMSVNSSALERLDKLMEGESQKWFKEMMMYWIVKYEPPVARFHEMPMPNQQEGDDAISYQHGGIGRKDKLDEKKEKKNPLQEPIESDDKRNLPPQGDGVMATMQAFPGAVVKDFDPMDGRVKPEDWKLAYSSGQEDINTHTVSSDQKKRKLHPPEQEPIEAAGTKTVQPSVQKDFPKQVEGGWIGELDEHPEGKDKIGSKPKPIEPPLPGSLKKTQGWSMKPTVVTGDEQEEIEHDDKYKKSLDLEEFAMGMKVEEEHKDITGGDPIMTAKIVLAHLEEDPHYYTKLKTVEKAKVFGAPTPYATGAFPNPAELTNREEVNEDEKNKEDAPEINKEPMFSKNDTLFDEVEGLMQKAAATDPDQKLPLGARAQADFIQRRMTKGIKMTVYKWLKLLNADDPIIQSVADLRKALDTWRISAMPSLENNMLELMNKGLKAGITSSKVSVPEDEDFSADIEDFKDSVEQLTKEIVDNTHKILKNSIVDYRVDKGQVRALVNKSLDKLDTRINLMVRTETSKLVYLGLLLGFLFLKDKDEYNYYWENPNDERSKDISLDRMSKSPYNYDTINFLWTHQEEFINGKWQADQYNNRCHIRKGEKRAEGESKGNIYANQMDRFKRTTRLIRRKKQ